MADWMDMPVKTGTATLPAALTAVPAPRAMAPSMLVMTCPARKVRRMMTIFIFFLVLLRRFLEK